MIFRSPHPAITIPNISLTDFVLRSVKSEPSKPALIEASSGRTITYGELEPLIRRLAAGFASHGVSKGDVLAIYSPNLPEYILAFHAFVTLGGVVTMVPPLFTVEEVTRQIADSGASYLLTIPELLPHVREIAKANKGVRKFVLGESDEAISWSSLLQQDESASAVKIDPATDLAALPYSSGTTGFPKGVMLTHRNLVSMLCQMRANDPFTENDVLICVVPMYHLYGLHIVCNLALAAGATVVTLPRYNEQQFLKTLERYHVTIAPLVPPIVLALSRSPEVNKYDLSALQLIHCGAASLADDVAKACSQRLNCTIRYGYGLTEVSPLSHATVGNGDNHKPGSVGNSLPNTECKIVNYATGAELGPNQQGEILIRGPQVMKGYLNNATATAEMIDKDGWLRTGDIGYVDQDGELFVVDRLKELIKYKGRQVAPAELEAILLQHPAVADAAVIPSSDREAGEIPKAFIVLKGEAPADEILSFVAERVAPHKRIRLVEFVSEIPKSPAGKILRRVLVDRDRKSSK